MCILEVKERSITLPTCQSVHKYETRDNNNNIFTTIGLISVLDVFLLQVTHFSLAFKLRSYETHSKLHIQNVIQLYTIFNINKVS